MSVTLITGCPCLPETLAKRGEEVLRDSVQEYNMKRISPLKPLEKACMPGGGVRMLHYCNAVK
jgi:hypothetical protein